MPMSTNILEAGKMRVAVLRGGPSSEYDISLMTGNNVIRQMPEKYIPIDVFISKDGVWHVGGLERSPGRALDYVDVVWNGLHGKYGEDGKVQALLENLNKPYTGSRALASAMGMHKGYAKAVFSMNSLQTPHHIVIGPKENTKGSIIEIFQSFPQPSVVKPMNGGSSLATTLAKDFSTFEKAIQNAFRYSGEVLIEEYIDGKEATCGVVDAGDGKTAFALLPAEIIPSSSKPFFDYDAKYNSKDNKLCPGSFADSVRRELQELSLKVHKALGLRHYSRADFIVSKNRGIYLLEVNSLPGLTENSPFPIELGASGISMSDFIDRTITLALSQ
jgi:D-alanine-D-alanine ligase